jgi:hypothetical protein
MNGIDAGSQCAASAVRVARLFICIAMLTAVASVARAQGPLVVVPSNPVVIGEDTSTNVPITFADVNGPAFTVEMTATSSDTNVISNASLVFGDNGTNRILAIQPGSHQYGTNIVITIVATDAASLSTTNTFDVTVTFTNYAPTISGTFTPQTISENGTLTLSFTVSDVQTPASNLVVAVTCTNSTLVPSNNISITNANGSVTLNMTPATNQHGFSHVTVSVTDSNNVTTTINFLLTVNFVNQPPTFTLASTNLTYPEYAGLVVIPNFATGVSAGVNQANEQTTWVITPSVPAFFHQLPSIDINGTLTFEVVTDDFGTNTITFALTNSGGVLNGGNNSLSVTVTLNVYSGLPVPTFTLASSIVTLPEESPGLTNANFVSSFSKGFSLEDNASFSYSLFAPTNSTNALFTTLSVATNGTLSVKPKPHSYGVTPVTMMMTVNGKYPGWVNTATNTFVIDVTQVSHAPVIVGATNQTVLENATNVTAQINVWDYDAQSTNFYLTVTSSNSGLGTVSVTSVTNHTPTNAVFTLTFTLATNNSGTIPVHVIASEGALTGSNPFTATNNFNLTVTLVNQQPSFTLTTSGSMATNWIYVPEDSPLITVTNFVASINKGPTNQDSENVSFAATTATKITTTNATNALFKTLAISSSGTLTVQPQARSFGSNLVTLVMNLSGGAKGGVNLATHSFYIGVAPTNHAPTIVATNKTVLENATNGLTATVNVWTYDAGQSTNLILTAVSSNSSLATVTVGPNVPQTGTNAHFLLTFGLTPDDNGSSVITLVASESALSTTNTVTLTVTLVNQQPSFNLATNWINVTEESAAVNITNFIASVDKGPNQTNQTYTFTTSTVSTNATNAAFQTLAVSAAGTLTVQPKPHSYGTNTVHVVMALSGGDANRGINTATNTFDIAVSQVNHTPVIVATNTTVLENSGSVTATVNVWDYDQLSSTLGLTATTSNANFATVTVSSSNLLSATNATFTLTLTPGANFNGTIPIHLVANEGAFTTNGNFNLIVTPVSKSPGFVLLTNFVGVAEEALPQNISNFIVGWKSSSKWSFVTMPVAEDVGPSNATFTTGATVTGAGVLTFAPAPHSVGTNVMEVIMTDNTNFFTNIFEIGVSQITHAPVITGATNIMANENDASPSELTNIITVSSLDPGVTGFAISATALTSNVVATVSFVTNGFATNSTYGGSNTLCGIKVTLLPNSSGVDTIQLTASETFQGSTNTTNSTFTVNVAMVEQAPSFFMSTNGYLTNTAASDYLAVVVPENSGPITLSNFATAISVGPANQSSQTYTFTVFTTNRYPTNAQFSAMPAIDTNGTLSFTSASNSFGTCPVTVLMSDSDTTDPGIYQSSKTFLLDVKQVLVPPVISALSNMTIWENQSTNLTQAFTVYDEVTSNFALTFRSSSNIVSATTNSAIPGSYTLVLSPTANSNGTATVTVQVSDTNSQTSSTDFTVTILPVEQLPVISQVSPARATAYGVLQTFPNQVTGSLGPPNQGYQTLSYVILTDSNPGLFTSQPAISAAGTLTFTPGITGGTAVLSFVASNSIPGNPTNPPPGVYTSYVSNLSIVVPFNAFAGLTGSFAGLFTNSSFANENSGFFSLVLADDGTFTATIQNAGVVSIFNGQFPATTNNSIVTVTNSNGGTYIMVLTNLINPFAECIIGTVSNTPNWVTPLTAYYNQYSSTFPTPLAGLYTMSIPANTNTSPLGDSVFDVTVMSNGTVNISADMADDTQTNVVSLISPNGQCPLYLPLYQGGTNGSLIGWLNFTNTSLTIDTETDSLDTNSPITWFNEGTTLYSAGFTNTTFGIAAPYSNAVPLLSFSDNVTVILSGASLTSSITNTVTINHNTITENNDGQTNQLTLSIVLPASGEVTGGFLDQGGVSNTIYGIIIQNTTNVVRGYFVQDPATNAVGAFIMYQ